MPQPALQADPVSDSGDKENAGYKTLRILSAIGELGLHSGGEVRLVDLVRATGYTRPTVHRLLNTMKACGMVTQEASGPYRFGPQMHLLAQQAFGAGDIRRMALPLMKGLSEDTGHTVHLAVRDGGEVVYVDKVEPTGGLHVSSAIGQRRPLQFTALGKALLAYVPADVTESMLPEHWPARTANSLQTREALVRQFGEIRQTGYAIDNEESDAGFRCVAAPILTRGGIAVAAISVTTVSSRTPMAELKVLGLRIAETAAAISRALGH